MIHCDPQEERLINEAEQVRRLFDVESSQDGSKRQERDNKVPGYSPYKRTDQ